MVDVEIYRKIYVFANEFFEDTYCSIEKNEKLEERNERAIIKAALWYSNHLSVNIIKNLLIIFILKGDK